MFVARLTENPIDLDELLRSFSHPHIGARVVFSGEIRGLSHGSIKAFAEQTPGLTTGSKEVVRLEYTAHKPLAEKHMLEVVRAAAEEFPLIGALCVHRIGMLEVSESAVVVVTAGRHRTETYAANQYIINRVKAETPIWKKEFFADGTSIWGENCTADAEQHTPHVARHHHA